jgi:hypothetical protein
VAKHGRQMVRQAQRGACPVRGKPVERRLKI